MYDILELNDKLLADLRQIAKTLNIKRVESYKKQELIYKILDQQALVAAQSEPVVEPAAPEAAAPVEKREKKPRIRVVRPGVEKVGDSKIRRRESGIREPVHGDGTILEHRVHGSANQARRAENRRNRTAGRR